MKKARLLMCMISAVTAPLVFAATSSESKAPPATAETARENPALTALRIKAGAGDAASQLSLALMYEKGTDGMTQDYEQAYAWCAKAAAQSYAPAEYNLGLMKCGMAVPQTADEAKKLMSGFNRIQAATNEYPTGWENVTYYNRRGVSCTPTGGCHAHNEDFPGALAIFRTSAGRGYAPAQFVMGNLSSRGSIFTYHFACDDAQALAWWTKAAEQGHIPAQLRLANAYAMGSHMPCDFEKAKFWMLKAAALGDEGATATNFKELKENIDFRNDLFAQDLKRAEAGDAEAQNGLGCDYLNGSNCVPNPEEGLRLLKLAVAGGSESATYNLAGEYASGKNIQKNSAEAIRLYRLAADSASPPAQRALGSIYAQGDGVKADPVEAWARYEVTVMLGFGDDMRTRRDEMGKTLSAEQLATAKELAQKIWAALPAKKERYAEMNKAIFDRPKTPVPTKKEGWQKVIPETGTTTSAANKARSDA